MTLILIVVVLLLFGGGGFYGYRSGYYGRGGFGGILGLLGYCQADRIRNGTSQYPA